MGERTVSICSICRSESDPTVNTIFGKNRIYGNSLQPRTLKELPRVTLEIKIEGPEFDTLICDQCRNKVELLLDQITFRESKQKK